MPRYDQLPGRAWTERDLEILADFDGLTGAALEAHLRELERLDAEQERRRYAVENAGHTKLDSLGVCPIWEARATVRLGNAVRACRERVKAERRA